jgi:iron complex outermembrane receptor protein
MSSIPGAGSRLVLACVLTTVVLVAAFQPPTAVAQAAAETAGGASLAGRVVDAEGGPVPGVTVVLAGPAGLRRTATTDPNGAYAFDELAPGGYVVAVSADAAGLRTERRLRVAAGERAAVDLRLDWLLQDAVTVSGTITRELAGVPGGTALVSAEQLDQTRRHNLHEVLLFVPGVLARSRWGADETQLSVRGSGLRNNFHHRGLNLLINGVAFQDADGFGDFETLDLMATERVELWKGANALRYGGNTLGGALNFVTYSGATGAPLEAGLTAGSFGLVKAQAGTAGEIGKVRYYMSVSRSDHDGYREHAEQGRTRAFGNALWQLSPDLEVWTDLIYAQVDEKLPGALSRAEMESERRQANPATLPFDYGRFYDYGRVGFGVRRRMGGGQSVEATAFGQVRDVLHPIFQILDQDQRTVGGELRYAYEGGQAARLQRFVFGVAPQWGNNDERRYANVRGERGPLVNELGAEADNVGAYLESELRLSPALTLLAGARWDRAERRFEDRFPADGDRSDEISYSAASPKVGVRWRATEEVEVFANASRAYEPPLILELTSFGAPGFLPLDAQDARQLEVGTRGRAAGGLTWDVSLYHAELRNEIVNENVRPFPGAPFTVPSYRNVEETRHRGIELGLGGVLARDLLADADRLGAQLSYTWSSFTFVDDPAHGGNDLPGAPPHQVRAELRYLHPRGWWVAPLVDWVPEAYFVDSANTVENEGYLVGHLRAGFDRGAFGVFAELTNLSDAVYSGSVQVDSADGRYFEPSDGRSLAVGLRWRR